MRTYREIPACAALDPFVECFWTSREPAGCSGHRVLPDGCVDLLILSSEAATDPRILFVGTMTRPLQIPPAETSQEYLGIRFRPAATPFFFDLAPPEIVDRHLLYEDLSPAENRRLVERLGELGEVPARIRHLESFLLARRSNSRSCPPPIREFLDSFEREDVPISITELSRRCRVSRQHLGRLFRRWIGIGPKQLSRILRFRRLLQRVDRTPPPLSWVDLALEFGYFDQSHLIRDFRELGSLRPSQYRSRQDVQSGLSQARNEY